MNRPFVRVVVLNYDGGQVTIDCLESLRATQWPSDRFEIVLVDNGSIDGIAARVKRDFPVIRVLEPMSNLGFAKHVGVTTHKPTDGPGKSRPGADASGR